MSAAQVTGADAIHPGYGFLAENANFSEICSETGIKFIGPSPDMINRMGDKALAKETMRKVGVPVVPGSDGAVKSIDEAKKIADEVGYPIMLKASAGGGGKGMRIVWENANLEKMYQTASNEAEAAFGNPELYVEKFIENPRHVEPFRELFKDEVRAIGKELGLPAEFIERHPFPGPGLAVRVLGDITKERLDILREADQIFIDSIKEAGIYNNIWQAFTVLLPVQSVGVMGDARTYENVAALRAVTSLDGMTADWYRFDPDILEDISNKIIRNVRGINRVVYDISSKPPSTIEWE